MKSHDDPSSQYTIGELAELGGVNRRTVRYYVQRGLLPAPHGLGRYAHYTQAHLDTLIRIRSLQEAGTPLAAIESQLSHPGAQSAPNDPPRPPTPAPRYTAWTRIEIADGVELSLRDARLDSEQVRQLAEAVAGIIANGETK